MQRVEIWMAATTAEADFEGFGDYILSSYPTGLWLYDLEASASNDYFVFYVEDAGYVQECFETSGSESGLRVARVVITPVPKEGEAAIRDRLK